MWSTEFIKKKKKQNRENKYIYNVEMTWAAVFTPIGFWITALISIYASNQNKPVF